MKSILLLLFALFCTTMAHFGMGRPPPDAVVCTVTANKLFINGYYIRELKGAEIDELHKYMEDRTIFEDKMRAIKKRRDDEDFHILKISHRFRRDAKFDPSPFAVFDDKPIDKDSDKSDLPIPPEKPSFCQKPKMPIVFGGQCMVIENKVYIRDQPVRDLTNEEAAQVDEYRKQQEEYVEKWRQVMGMRMQIYGPEAHPRFNQMQDGGGRGGMQQQPQQQGQMQQQDQMQQQGQNQQQPQMGGGPMFGGMHGGMGGFSMGNIKDADLELPEEPQPPYKICTFIA